MRHMASPKYLATGMSAALLACVLGSSPVPVSAQSVEGEVITLVSPNSAGGMMTRYARMIAPYIAKYAGTTPMVS